MATSSPGTNDVNENENNSAVATIICKGHSRPIPQIEFKNTAEDGLFMISSCLDNRPMLRDGTTGDWIGSFVGHNGAVWCARLNSNATRAVTASADFSANYWCAVTGQLLHTFEHRHIVRATTFSKDDSKIFTAGHEGKIRIYDLKKPEAEPTICEDKRAKIQYLLTPSESLIVSSDDKEKMIKVWDTRTLKHVKSLETSGVITDLGYSLDSSLMCATAGNSAFFWDMKTFDLVKEMKTDRELMSVAVDTERNRLVLGSVKELWVRRYDFKSEKEVACNKGHHGPINSLAFSPDGSFASGSVDGTIRIWRWPEEKS
eukprot:jgi/Bigna1/45686/e_gw1.139.1.1